MMPLRDWGPASKADRRQSDQYRPVPTGGDDDSIQVQWDRSYRPGYITSIISGLSKMGSKTTMSDTSTNDLQNYQADRPVTSAADDTPQQDSKM